jgi:translation initiation factor IF-2
MPEVSITTFAEQIGVDTERLLKQLGEAGVGEKTAGDTLNEAEKATLLTYLQREHGGASRRGKITLQKKTTSQIRHTSRTGAARTIQVEVRKRRTFVRKSLLEQDQEQAEKQAAGQAPPGADVAPESSEMVEVTAKQAESLERALTAEVPATPAEAPVPVESQAEPQSPEGAGEQTARPVESKAGAVAKPDLPETAEVAVTPEPEGDPAQAVATEPVDGEAESGAGADSGAPEGEGDRRSRRAQPVVKPTEEDRRAAAAARARKAGVRPEAGAGRNELHVRRDARGRRKAAGIGAAGKRKRVQTSMSGQHGFERPTAPVIREVTVSEGITVAELAQQMSVKAAEVIRKMMMDLGQMATINQPLDVESATLIVEEFGHTVRAAGPSDPEALLMAAVEQPQGKLESRPPLVTGMGHVDHGKTSLLDHIRKSRVAAGEAGGITQHIGAYQVKTPKGMVTFLDTPGHEAFSAMRARGAKATDVVILVVAADDGVKPQTVEAINHARSAGVPIVVAINKMDREQADPDRVKQELSQHEVLPEEWGGDILMVPVSAITGQGIDQLLDAVLLQAELLELQAVREGPASGVVVEARLDRGRGVVATVLVQSGTLNRGDILLAGRETGRVRAMTDYSGRAVKEAGPAMPVEVQGLAGVPVAGDEVHVVSDEKRAREIAEHRQSQHREREQQRARPVVRIDELFGQVGEAETQALNLVVKADVQGSVEALRESLEKLSNDEVRVRVIHGMVGGISESDVNLAVAAGASIIGFNVRADAAARKLIENEGIEVHYHNVIYDVVDYVKLAVSGMLKPEIREQVLGLVEVRQVFRVPKLGAIAGCYVREGVVRRGRQVRVLRDNVVIFDGRLDSLRRFKEDVTEVKAGMECGIGVRSYNDVREGDQLEIYETIEVAQSI